MNLNRILQGVNQWLLQTPERSLDEAYHAPISAIIVLWKLQLQKNYWWKTLLSILMQTF